MTITIKPTPKQHQVYQALNNKKITDIFFGGGAGGGKTWVICESRLLNALRFPGYRSYIAREELKRLMQSTFVTWCKVCKYHNIPGEIWKLNGQYNYIEFTNGSRIDLLDAKFLPTDPLYERFGSLEYTDGAIEEAGEIHPLFRDVMRSRIGRHLNDKIHPSTLITGNPKKNWTYSEFYKPWKEGTLPDNKVFIQALYNDNEYTAESYGIQLRQLSDTKLKQRLMMGNWEYDDDPDALMTFDTINDLFTNTVDKGDKYLTVDVARFGKDNAVIMVWDGLKVIEVITISKCGIDQLEIKIKEVAQKYLIPYSRIIADEDGVGGGLVDNMRGIKGFVGNSIPLEEQGKKVNFKNLRSQCYYKLADYVNNHKMAITCSDTIKEIIIEELEQIKGEAMDSDQKLRIITKDKIKEIIGRSPDYADTLMMRMWFELKPQATNVFNQLQPKKGFI
ncbi:MAG: Terminase-like family protein [Tenericutes bacterium ADurb.Bin239]|nr:MAG: Terminase-like family protein [Tenericutes bacterium ADurb.Bin239]